MWARRAFSCFLKVGARRGDDPTRLGRGLPSPRSPTVSAGTAGAANVELKFCAWPAATNENDDDAAPTPPGWAVGSARSMVAAAGAAGPSGWMARLQEASGRTPPTAVDAARTGPDHPKFGVPLPGDADGVGADSSARPLKATPLARQRSINAGLKPSVGRPRSLSSDRSRFTVIRDAMGWGLVIGWKGYGCRSGKKKTRWGETRAVRQTDCLCCRRGLDAEKATGCAQIEFQYSISFIQFVVIRRNCSAVRHSAVCQHTRRHRVC